MSQKNTLCHHIEYGLFRITDRLVRLLSWRAAQSLGGALGRFLYRIDSRHRRVVRENLRQSDLGLTEDEITVIAKSCFAHFGSVLMTTPHLLHMGSEDLSHRITLEGLEHWDAAQDQGKGFILLTGHYGNWEAMALALAASGHPIAAIGRALDNPLLDAQLRTFRSRLGNRVIDKKGGVQDCIRELRQGRGVGFLLDQDALTRGIFVRFLGRWASTYPSAALLAVKYEIPVLPMFSWPNPDGTISARVQPPLEIPKTGHMERDIWTATQVMTRCLEDRIRQDPRWWFWMHRRFKTCPGEGDPLPAPLPPPEWGLSLSFPVNQG